MHRMHLAEEISPAQPVSLHPVTAGGRRQGVWIRSTGNIPGLIVTQHSGEGKANQHFLRAFNLDIWTATL